MSSDEIEFEEPRPKKKIERRVVKPSPDNDKIDLDSWPSEELQKLVEDDEEIEATLLVGNSKSKYDKELEECTIVIDVCKPYLKDRQMLRACLLDRFDEEIGAELTTKCSEELAASKYFGVKITHPFLSQPAILYPIRNPTFSQSLSSTRAAIRRLMLMSPEEAIKTFSGMDQNELLQLTVTLFSMTKELSIENSRLRKELKSVTKELIEIRDKCKNSEAISTINTLIDTTKELLKMKHEKELEQLKAMNRLKEFELSKNLFQTPQGPQIDPIDVENYVQMFGSLLKSSVNLIKEIKKELRD